MGVDASRQAELAKRLCRNEYWQRLWIIQEIAHAFRLDVRFGSSTRLEWEAFIEFVRKHEIDDRSGPIRLHRLRNEVVVGSCTLQALLVDHCDARCAEPRDKVYGLKGLAADADDLPVDYGKPLMEVWMDVMEFVNKKTTSKIPIMSFGALVRHLLMGDDITPLRRVLRPQGVTVNKSMHVGESKDPKSICHGWFRYWEDSVCGSIDGRDRDQRAKRRYVEEQSTGELSQRYKKCHQGEQQASACASAVTFDPDVRQSRQFHPVAGFALAAEYLDSTDNLAQMGKKDDVDKAPRLIQLRSRNSRITWQMGIASSQAEQGDLVVWVSGIRHAIVVRRSGNSKLGHAHLQVYGSAWITEDVARFENNHDERLRSFGPEDSLSLQMDAATIFVLVAQDDARCIGLTGREGL
ncbi:hypothetical protein PG994_009894 [Apiospora phragmitis]|uniref:Heterokaryon incompatibility domain-containing protein n=1 Tax=Apiospora phragmitis TaxID=2905665 RepID=A0ABR1TNC4_9PEZI